MAEILARDGLHSSLHTLIAVSYTHLDVYKRQVFARLTAMAGLEQGYLSTLVKVLGVSYVAELAAQTCQDLGEGGLALKVGLVGKLCVFTLTAPMLISLLEMILELTP